MVPKTILYKVRLGFKHDLRPKLSLLFTLVLIFTRVIGLPRVTNGSMMRI